MNLPINYSKAMAYFDQFIFQGFLFLLSEKDAFRWTKIQAIGSPIIRMHHFHA